jgi:GT2 family glycosyltransferase
VPTTRPRITAVVTVFRRTEFLATALDSVFRQTHPPVEVLVADDSDSRAVEAICRRYPADRLRYVPRRPTCGVARNVGQAIAEATGDYVAILNDDDVWEDDFLREAAAAIERDPAIDLFFSDHWLIDGAGRRLTDRSVATTAFYHRDTLPEGVVGDLAELVLVYNGVPLAMASVFRRAAVGADWLDPEIRGAYDFWLATRLAAAGSRAWYAPRRLTSYRVHEAMATAVASPAKYEEHVVIYRRLVADPRLAPWRNRLRKHLASHLRKVAAIRWRNGDAIEAKALAGEAWQVEPRLKSALLRLMLALRFSPAWIGRVITT